MKREFDRRWDILVAVARLEPERRDDLGAASASATS